MLRPSHLSSLTSPTLCAFRFSMFSLTISSSLKPHHNFSSLALLLTFVPKTFKHSSPSLPSQSFGWASPMVGSARLNGIASFSTGNNVGRGGAGRGREILVQHLLVTEDNLKLLLELQQRISGGGELSDFAAEYSICPSKEQGGMLGWVRKGQMRGRLYDLEELDLDDPDYQDPEEEQMRQAMRASRPTLEADEGRRRQMFWGAGSSRHAAEP
ncbi:hypothetical protein NE237_004446 [Protea cynaroides]|uniref:Peptidyl-prolyl cis-trans isomerase n=1 Tax=Protea cynaroides TaxID=273540 RepID=A0A9Q0KIT5_9MAGN|nr:hypothetical protein NE237_004446 [Protea cynaroides]